MHPYVWLSTDVSIIVQFNACHFMPAEVRGPRMDCSLFHPHNKVVASVLTLQAILTAQSIAVVSICPQLL